MVTVLLLLQSSRFVDSARNDIEMKFIIQLEAASFAGTTVEPALDQKYA